ncbi:unnamed protein product [Prorocentrum cordatum]|uniref:Uncharacterized protein n=1 Tax=Prorocentrum cordatum TaxID=2364126 RepID=A0ABN9QEA7_9DINO|nr:unnamed protein product [Polarella glacialis]
MDANMTSQTNSEREQRLRELISEFRTAATDGIRVELVDKESQLVCQGIFKLDSAQMTMSLQPAFLPETSWSMREIGAVMKGKEFARCVPELAHLSAKCIGLRILTLRRRSDAFTSTTKRFGTISTPA